MKHLVLFLATAGMMFSQAPAPAPDELTKLKAQVERSDRILKDWANLGRYAAGKSKAVRFERPGIVRVFCDIHSHMSAFILVFAHRYFAVTDDEGRYRLDGIPPGSYTVLVWNETVRGDPPRRTVTIGESGGDVDADFSIR